LTTGKYGIIQSFSCANVGNKSDVDDKSPPCREQGPNAWDGRVFPRLQRGKAPNVKAPATPYAPGTNQPKHYK
jgi:hypothetical protein